MEMFETGRCSCTVSESGNEKFCYFSLFWI